MDYRTSLEIREPDDVDETRVWAGFPRARPLMSDGPYAETKELILGAWPSDRSAEAEEPPVEPANAGTGGVAAVPGPR
jgi:hypothetical protein